MNKQHQRKDKLITVAGELSPQDASIIKHLGYTVKFMESGQEMLDFTQTFRPALILVGAKLTDMAGDEVIDGLRDQRILPSVPIIGIHQQDDRRALDILQAERIMTFLPQPFDLEAVYCIIQRQMESYPRKCVRTMLQNPIKTNIPVEAAITEISAGGMLIQARTPAQVKTRHKVEFNLDGNAMSLEAAVVYAGRNFIHNNYDIGLSFTRIKEEQKNLIRSFVHKEFMRPQIEELKPSKAA